VSYITTAVVSSPNAAISFDPVTICANGLMNPRNAAAPSMGPAGDWQTMSSAMHDMALSTSWLVQAWK